jgi:hypothetical protein
MYSIGHYLVTLSIFLVLHISGNVQTDHVVLLFDLSLFLSCFNNIVLVEVINKVMCLFWVLCPWMVILGTLLVLIISVLAGFLLFRIFIA